MKTVCVLGGTGFVGSEIVRQLSERGYLVKVLSRDTQHGKHLSHLNNVQIISSDVLNADSLRQHLQGANIVINLVGILHESKKMSFERVHTALPGQVAKLCSELGITRLLHMSALQASNHAPSSYLRSKAKGEQAVLEFSQQLNITIFQPSVIFGAGDSFINLFAKLVKLLPIIVLAKPQAKFQPIYVKDVATAFVYAIEAAQTFGKTYELAGPKVYSLKQIIQLVAKALNKQRLIIGLNDGLSYLQAWMLEQLPVKMMTRDNVKSMEVDSVSHQAFPDYLDFKPSALEEILPSYISH